MLDERFSMPYANRFEEGEVRKRAQFMYGGDLLRVVLRYTGESVESVLDRLPTAEIVEEGKDGTVVRAEVIGCGIKNWILSQADKIEVLQPQALREEIKAQLCAMMKKYE